MQDRVHQPGPERNLGFLKKVFRLLGFIGFFYKDGTRQYDPKAHENKGGATVLKVGGGQFCERSEPKIFFDPPTFWPVEGDKILLR